MLKASLGSAMLVLLVAGAAQAKDPILTDVDGLQINTTADNQKVIGKGSVANYWGYYGNYYNNLAGYYGNYGLYANSSTYYFNAYVYQNAAATSYYNAYQASYHGF